MTIRRIEANDLHALRELFAVLRQEQDPNIYPNFLYGRNAKRFVDLHRDWRSTVSIVSQEESGKLVGFVSMFLVADYARLTLNAVHPRWRGQGLGRPVLEYALAAVHGAGSRRVGLGVFEGNVAALSLYRQVGFVPWSGPVFPQKAHLLVHVLSLMGYWSTAMLVGQVMWKVVSRRDLRLIELVFIHHETQGVL